MSLGPLGPGAAPFLRHSHERVGNAPLLESYLRGQEERLARVVSMREAVGFEWELSKEQDWPQQALSAARLKSR